MASKAILAMLANIVACSPCAGTFGRWKAELQDDDADLWNDLTLINAIPNVKPPDIPKVVEVISCSDGSDEDVSTLANETSQYSNSHYRWHIADNHNTSLIEEENYFSPSPKETTVSRDHIDPDPELDQVLEEIVLVDDCNEDKNKNGGKNESGDAELESIMGPRSQQSMARSHASRRIRRASSDPVVPMAQPPSLLQQRREHYHSSTLARHPSEVPGCKGNADKEYRDSNPDHDRNIPSAEELRGPRDEPIDHDGSSYSSVHQKASFFKRKRHSFFRSGGSSGYKKAGSDGNWLLQEHSRDSTEGTTMSTGVKSKNNSLRSHSRLRLKPFH